MGLCCVRFCHIYDVQFYNHTNNSINVYIFISTFFMVNDERVTRVHGLSNVLG